jgi:hypothetical protein
MIKKLKRMIMILGKVMMSIIFLIGCDSPQCMKDYYITHKNNLLQIRSLSDGVADNYAFEKITIIKKRGELEILFSAEVGGVSMYVNPEDFSLIHEFANSQCSPEVLQRFRALYNNNTFREILYLFESIKPKALRISHGGVFIALGSPLKSPNVNLDGGILMTFKSGVADYKIVETIDTNVYLYDTLVY